MGVLRAWALYRKANKAWKESKQLMKEKKGLADEVKEIKSDIEALLIRIINILPPFKETAEELSRILKEVL